MYFLKPAMVLFLLLLIFFNSHETSAQMQETGFLNRSVTIGKSTYRYQVFVPSSYTKFTKKKKWPVILFLHGRGERGEDGLLQTDVGIGSAIRRHVERFPVIVVMPQCNSTSHWTQEEMATQALKALSQTVTEFNGDVNRVYLTGISMGGAGSWYIAAKYNKFAAIAPICGWVVPPQGLTSLSEIPPEVSTTIQTKDPYLTIAEKIGKTPVWIFHGDEDTTVPVTESRKMAEAIKLNNGIVKYTEYEGAGHNSWDQAYSEPELIPWLLSHQLGKPNPANSKELNLKDLNPKEANSK